MSDKIGTGTDNANLSYTAVPLEQRDKKGNKASVATGKKARIQIGQIGRAQINKALAKLPSLSKTSARKAGNGGLSFDTGGGGLLMAPANQPDPMAAELMLMKLQSKIGNEEAKHAEHDIRYRGQKQKDLQIKRMEQRQQIMAQQHSSDTLKTIGKIFGWVGIALSVVAAVLIGVFVSPIAAIPLVVAIVATATVMILEQSGAIDELMKDASPQAKEGVSYGLMALMLIINLGAAVASGGLSLAPALAEAATEGAVDAVEVGASATEVATEAGSSAGEMATETAGEVAADATESGIEASGTAARTTEKVAEEATEEAVEESGRAATKNATKVVSENAEKLAEKAAGSGKFRKVVSTLVRSPLRRNKGSSIVRLGMVAMRAGNAAQGTIALASAGVAAGATAYAYKASLERAMSKEDLAEITKLIAMDSESRDRIQEVIDNIDRGFVNLMQQISTRDSTSTKIISRIGKA